MTIELFRPRSGTSSHLRTALAQLRHARIGLATSLLVSLTCALSAFMLLFSPPALGHLGLLILALALASTSWTALWGGHRAMRVLARPRR